MITVNETARILIEALPYIRRFTGKTIVVKVGGVPMTDPARMRSLAKDVLLLHSVGIRPVLVHGGGQKGSVVLTKLRKLGPVTESKSGELRPSEFPSFVAAEVRSHGGSIDQEAAGILVQAVGQDLRSLAAAPVSRTTRAQESSSLFTDAPAWLCALAGPRRKTRRRFCVVATEKRNA